MIRRGRLRAWLAGLAFGVVVAPVYVSALETSLRPNLRPTVGPASAAAQAAPISLISARPQQGQDVLTGTGALIGAGALTGTDALTDAVVRPEVQTGGRAGMRPVARPVSAQMLASAALPVDLLPSALNRSLVPTTRPDTIVEQALFKRRRLRKGAVCDDVDIQGKPVGAVAAKLPGCGAKDAVQVTSVAGVTLSQASVMTCETAQALKHWVSKDVETAFGRRNKVVSLRVAAHYSCRTRNNRPGARISEHGRGKAIDISGFTLEDGTLVSVLHGWNARKTRKPMAKIWKAACGPFGTVLGPQSDRYHRDHFHLDVARHRGGAYCR